MSQFIELKTGKENYTERYTSQVINCDLIRSISDRPGYSEPMVTVVVDGGTRGHWESRGANSVFKELHCYAVYAELAAKLCGSNAPQEPK